MQNMIKKTGNKTLGIPENYFELIKTFPPRPITSEEELNATQEIIDSLLDRANLTPDQQDYLHLLGLLVSEYEKQNYPIPDIYGVDLLKVLIEEFNLQEKDLVTIFKNQSIVSEILNGQRQLTVEDIQKLVARFHISPIVFFSSQ